MRYFILFSFSLLCCLFSCSSSSEIKEKEDDVKQEEDVLASVSLSDKSGKQIEILAWDGIRSDATPEMYKDMADAGFTSNKARDISNPYMSKFDPKELFTALDNAAAVNIKQMVAVTWLEKLNPEDLKKLINHPALDGYFVEDEPLNYERIDYLKEWVDRVKKIDDSHYFYINLAPCDCRGANWAPELIGCTGEEVSPCERFTKAFVDEVDVPMVSFDRYTVNIDAKTNQRKLMPGWYYTMEIMARQAKRSGRPLWAFALSSEHRVNEIYYPIPTINDLRLQVYSDLAYGAQCIQYFTYVHIDDASFGLAPLAADGTKTETYYKLKEINKEIIALSPVFLNSKNIWVAHTGVVPDGCVELDYSKLPSVFDSLEITGGNGALVSLIEKGNDNFLVVVNHDINGVVNVKAKGSKLYRVNKEGNPVLLGEQAQKLVPGDAVIYFWKK